MEILRYGFPWYREVSQSYVLGAQFSNISATQAWIACLAEKIGMNLDPHYFIITFPELLGVAAVAVLVMAIAVLAGAAFIKHLFLTREESEKIQREAHHKSAKTLEDARAEAARIVENANTEATGIIRAAHALAGRATKELEEELHVFSQKEADRLREAAESFAGVYREMAKHAEDAYAEATKHAVEAIGRETAEGLSRFSSSVENEAKRYQRSVDELLEERQKAVRHEIDAYKSDALKKLDESIYRVLLTVSRQSIGKVLDFKDHQELVLRSLKEAKEEGFFNHTS